MTTLASAFVEVRPDLSKFPALLKAGADTSATTAGKSSGGKFSTAFQASTRGVTDVDPNTTSATSAGRVSGGRFGAAFEGVTARITDLDPDATSATSAGRVTGVRFGAAFDGATARIGAIDADPGIASSAGRTTGAAFAQGFTLSTPDLGDVDADRGQAAAAGGVAGRAYGRAFAASSAAGGAGLGAGLGASGAAGGVLAIGAAAAVVTGLSVKLEAQFSSTMNQLQAATLAPQKEIRKLSDLAIKFGRDTVFSASDAGEAMLELAKGGISTATIRTGALEGALDLAAAGGLEMGAAAEVMVSAFGQFNLEGKDAAAVAAALAGAANASSSNVDELAFALSQGGLAANAVGFSVQETTGILAAFANSGLRGSDAGTSLKTALDRLVPTTGTALGAFRDLGLITEENGNRFLKANGEYKNAAQVSEILKDATEGLASSERKRLISLAFGSDAQRAATVLAKEGGAGIREMVKATSDLGAAQRIGAARMKGTAGAFEQLKGSAETVALQFGQVLAPAAQAVFLTLAKGLNRLPGLFSKVAGFVREHATLLKTIGIVIGALVLPWFLVLGAAFVVLWKKSETFRDIVKGAFHGVQVALAAVGKVAGPVFAELVDGFQFVVRFVRAQWPAVAKTVSEVFAQIKVGVRALFGVIRPLFTAGTGVIRDLWDKFGGRLVSILRTVYDAIKEVLKNGFRIIGGIFQAALAVLRGDWGEAWKHIKEVLDAAWDSIKVIVKAAVSVVRQLIDAGWDAVKSGTRAAWDAVKEAIRNTWDGIKSILGGVKDFLVDKVVGAFGFAVGKIKDIWNKLIEIALKPVNFFIGTVYNDGIRAVFNKIAGFLPGDTAELSAFPPLGKARGGPIPGHSPSSTADNIPVWTTAREWVIRQQSSDRLNRRFPGFLAHLNETGSPEGYRPPRSVSTPGGDPGDFGLAKGGEVSNQMRSRFAAGLRFFQRAMVGKPYSWGGAGPGRFDCSGAMSALARYIMGHRPPWGRLGTSASAPNWSGFARGSGSMFNVGYAANYRGSGFGHVAGTLLGTNVESASGVGVRMGGSARGANDPGFNGIMHLGPGGVMAGGAQGGSVFSGIARAVLRAVQAAIKAIKEDIASERLSGSNRLNRGLRGGGGMAVEGLTKLLAKAQARGTSGGGGATGLYKGDHSGLDRASPAVAQAYARKMLPKYGWKPGQFAPLKNLWNKESGWRWNADNPSSTAYGIPQSKPGSKMAASGSDWRTNAGTQVDWGLGYIKGRYGAPTGAWGHSQNVGWYDQGGVLRDGGTAKNKSGKPEAVLTAEQWRDIRKLIAAVFVGNKPSAITPEFITGQLDRDTPSATQLKKRYGEAMKDYREQLEQAKGAREALNQAERRAKNLDDAIDKARKAGHKDHMQDLKERRDEIQKLVRQRDRDFDKQKRQSSRAEEAAKKAAAAYAAAQRAAIEQAKTVAGSVTGLGSLANSPFRSSAGIVGNLRRSILIAKDWGSVVKNLIKAGLRGPILQEFIAEGPSFEAVALGRNLLRAGDIDEIVALQDRLARIGREVGGIAVSDPRRGGGRRAGQAIDRARTGTGTRERRSTIDRLEVHFHGVYDTPAAMAQELGAELARKGIY